MSPEDTRFDDELRARAVAQPLATDQALTPVGPCLWPRSVTSAASSEQCGAEGRPSERRPIIQPLVGAALSRAGWQSLSFQLLRQLSGGEDSFAQVWLVEASVNEQVVGQVVLKLLVEELFPRNEVALLRADRSAHGSAAAEAMAYERLLELQGLSVPHCYGSFNLTIPSGSVTHGIVLEDLTDSATIEDYLASHRDVFDSAEKLDDFAGTLLELVHSVHSYGVASLRWAGDDVVLLASSTAQRPRLVVMDFGDAVPAEDYAQKWKSEKECRWPVLDEHYAYMKLENSLGRVATAWYHMAYDRDPTWLAYFARHEYRLRTEDWDEDSSEEGDGQSDEQAVK